MCTRAVGALGHYFEEEGLPTTQISLIRLHTEGIKPPRALWVPFELGRPLGVPGDPAFQRKVLEAALKLLEAPSGPIIEDYPEEAPASQGEITALACPVNFVQDQADISELEKLGQALKNEISALHPWYDMAVEKRGRTTVMTAGTEIDATGDFIFSFLGDETPENPRDDIPIGFSLKLAADDLKAYYLEGITAQPGQEYASSQVLTGWFWNETVAGKVLLNIKSKLENNEDNALRIAARALLVPRIVADATA